MSSEPLRATFNS